MIPTFLVRAQFSENICLKKPIKILIVPGHDKQSSGARYKNLKEADMTLVLGTEIYNLLKQDKNFEVYITRDNNGYTKDFSDYFAQHVNDIQTFKDNAQKKVAEEITNGTFIKKTNNVPHFSVKGPVALRLYGINKWADENNIDVMIHVHFNDEGRKNISKMGKYKGFSVYAPDPQLLNSSESMPLAQSIYRALKDKYINSTYTKENGGVVPDQKLIAVGANDTLSTSVRSVLVEYGFIYEKRFSTYTKRNLAYKDMANLTFEGIKNYFFN